MLSESWYALQGTRSEPGETEAVRESASSMARRAEKTPQWFLLQFDETRLGIFDTFPDKDRRQAHLDGNIVRGLLANANELLAAKPETEETEVVAAAYNSQGWSCRA